MERIKIGFTFSFTYRVAHFQQNATSTAVFEGFEVRLKCVVHLPVSVLIRSWFFNLFCFSFLSLWLILECN